MKRKNIRTMVGLTGGYGTALREALRRLPEAHPGQFIVFTEPVWAKASDPDYAKYKILFGTDASGGTETPQQTFGDALYEIYYRFLEPEDEYFDYTSAHTPSQGRWRIYGLGLPETVLRRISGDNAFWRIAA